MEIFGVKVNATSRLAGKQVKAVSEKMKPEMDKAMAAFVKAFGTNYKKDTDADEGVYWELGRGSDYVSIGLDYMYHADGIRYTIDSELFMKESKIFSTCKDMLRDLKSYVKEQIIGEYLTPTEKVFTTKIKDM